MSSMASFSSLMAADRLLRPTGPPSNFSMIVRSRRRSISSKPCSSTWRSASVAHAPQQAVDDALRAARAAGDLVGGSLVDDHAEDARRAAHDFLEIGARVEIQAVDDAEARAQGRGQESGARGGPDERERR